MIGAAGRADAGAFLARLLRLDPAAVVRLRPPRLYPGAAGRAELWAPLPFGVMVMRLIAMDQDRLDPVADVTVPAAELLQHLGGAPTPRVRDEAWRWPLPSQRGRVIESIPARDVLRVAAAASQTLRKVTAEGLGGRQIGERMMRDALLDHVPIVVTGPDGDQIDVPQRLVQAAVRMGFVRIVTHASTTADTQGDNSVTVRLAGRWLALECSYGSAWYLPTSPLRLS